MLKSFLLLLAFLFLRSPIYSQTINHPNYGIKSHPTLEIESIALASGSTTLFMVIENRILEGSFCADKNIFIVLPAGKRLKVTEAEGIPRCPEVFTFQNIGEKLYFTLTLPALPSGTKWFDLIEDCNDACFSFNGVILDEALNRKIDHAYSLIDAGDKSKAIIEFEALLNEFSGKNCSYEGSIYSNLIELSRQTGSEKKADEWLQKLKDSDIPLKGKYLESLRK